MIKFLTVCFATSLSLFAHPSLVNLEEEIPSAHFEIRYATTDNFTGKVVYESPTCLLHKEAATALKNVQLELETMGLSIKVWDGYRPFSAQEKFWELVPDPRYVSDPKKGGRHTRGTAIDLTLVTKEGKELPMPSLFDDFSEKAYRNYMGASREAIINRELLRLVMEKHGFEGLPTEWWHFDYKGWKEYPPIKDATLSDCVR